MNKNYEWENKNYKYLLYVVVFAGLFNVYNNKNPRTTFSGYIGYFMIGAVLTPLSIPFNILDLHSEYILYCRSGRPKYDKYGNIDLNR